MKYFNRFPVVDYDGKVAKNLLARVDFIDSSKKDIYSNFDYVLEEGAARPDVISNNYYNSPYYDWLIYLSNGVVDPYHDYYKSAQDFNSYITAKYGSSTIARRNILFYRNDWSADESLISESVYDALSSSIKKYWKPRLNNTGQIVGYERVKEDWTVSTNQIVKLVITADLDNFNIGDIVEQNGAEGTVILKNADDNSITLQHITGAFVEDVEDGIISVTVLKKNISDEEAAFWSPVSAYEYEEEQNELKRYVNIIKSSYLPDIEKQFVELIKR